MIDPYTDSDAKFAFIGLVVTLNRRNDELARLKQELAAQAKKMADMYFFIERNQAFRDQIGEYAFGLRDEKTSDGGHSLMRTTIAEALIRMMRDSAKGLPIIQKD